jgi:hypothetical protein
MTKYDDVYTLIQTFIKSNNNSRVESILKNQTLNTLKKLCTKQYFGVKNCSSSDITGSATQRKNKLVKRILESITGKSSSPNPSPEVSPTVISLKSKLKDLKVTAGLSKLKKDELVELVEDASDPDNRCLEDDDYKGCDEDETCSIKNQLCRDEDFKMGNLKNKEITKEGDDYKVLATKQEAKNLQEKIDIEEGPEMKSETKKEKVKKLKKLLKNMGVKRNIKQLTNYNEEDLLKLLDKPRCKEETDYDDCDGDDACHTVNEICVDKKFDKVGKLERRSINKGGKIYYILSTKEHADELQKKINSEQDETKLPNIEGALDDILSTSDPSNFSKRKLYTIIQEMYPNVDQKYIKSAVRSYINLNYTTDREEIQSEDRQEDEEDVYKNRINKFKEEGMVNTKPDGDCFFHAIRHLISRTYGKKISVNECRNLIVSMMAQLVEINEEFRDNLRAEAMADNIGNENDYLAHMIKPGVWAGEPEIIAVSSIFSCIIIVKTARLDAENLIIPNKIYQTPNNFIISHSSLKNMNVDNNISPFNYVWTIYHTGIVSNHYQYNKHIFTNQLFLPNDKHLPNINFTIHKKNNYTDSTLNKQFNSLLKLKNVSTKFKTSQIPPSSPIRQTIYEPQQLTIPTFDEPSQPSYPSPMVMKAPISEPSPPSMIETKLFSIQDYKQAQQFIINSVSNKSTRKDLLSKWQNYTGYKPQPQPRPQPQVPVFQQPPQVQAGQNKENILLTIDNEQTAKQFIRQHFPRDGRRMFNRWLNSRGARYEEKVIVPKVKKPGTRITMQYPSQRKSRPTQVQTANIPVYRSPRDKVDPMQLLDTQPSYNPSSPSPPIQSPVVGPTPDYAPPPSPIQTQFQPQIPVYNPQSPTSWPPPGYQTSPIRQAPESPAPIRQIQEIQPSPIDYRPSRILPLRPTTNLDYTGQQRGVSFGTDRIQQQFIQGSPKQEIEGNVGVEDIQKLLRIPTTRTLESVSPLQTQEESGKLDKELLEGGSNKKGGKKVQVLNPEILKLSDQLL